jgi:hypothetical protein
MKKISTLTIFLFGIILSSWSQIPLSYENQAIHIGDQHHFRLANMAEEGPAGPNQVWDFSSLKIQGDLTSYMIDALLTPNGTKIPEATSVIKEGESNFYFSVSKSDIKEYGLASCNSVYRYDQPLTKIKFPFRYGDHSQGVFHGSDVNNAAIQLNGTYQIEADAYGKLILPDNVVISNVLRLKSTRTDLMNNTSNTTITYRWYCADVRYPLVTIIKYVNKGNAQTSLTAYYADAGSIAKNSKKSGETEWLANDNFKFSAYPNPYTETININYYLYKQSDVNISIADNMGRTVHTLVNLTQDEGQYTKSFTGKDFGLNAGVYIVRIKVNGKVETAKIIQL